MPLKTMTYHQQTTGTVFFVDMRNFTLLTSKMSNNPREDEIVGGGQTQYEARLAFLINEMSTLYQSWRSVLEQHAERGEIDRYLTQFAGDGVMVALEGRAHAEVAMEAAVDMGMRMRDHLDGNVNPRIEALGVRRRSDWMSFGIGICSGSFAYVDLGPDLPGSGEGSVSTIIGTAANHASRVEAANKEHVGAQITIAEPTIRVLCANAGVDYHDHRSVEDRFGVRYLWKHRFKGIDSIGLYVKPFED